MTGNRALIILYIQVYFEGFSDLQWLHGCDTGRIHVAAAEQLLHHPPGACRDLRAALPRGWGRWVGAQVPAVFAPVHGGCAADPAGTARNDGDSTGFGCRDLVPGDAQR